ncbi:MAG: tetratricopeptide repeat protein [Candidatus Cloacimonetes bacterium]|nr:tetratricopeptide repeat protein [Candidatus Cloacimonadota bacterium]
MSQHSDILVSSPKPQAQQAQRFHDLRMQFNSAFLAEDFAQAEAVCLKALEILDNGKSEIEELIRYFRMLGKGEKALDLARDSLTQNPGDSRLISITLDLLLQLGYVEEYEVLLRDVIDRYPDSERYYQLYHDFLISNSRSEELAAIAQQADATGIEISHTETDSLADEDGQVKTVIPMPACRVCCSSCRTPKNAYARQWANEQGASGYSLVNEPFNSRCPKKPFAG